LERRIFKGGVMEIKRFEFTDTLGWSVSRFDKFLTCKRQYFFDYYPKYDTENPIEKLLFLKKLTSKPLETGNIIHDMVKDLLLRYQKSSKPLNIQKFFEYAKKMTLQYCNKTFYESYYGNEIVDPLEIFKKVTVILENLIESQRFKWIQENALAQRKDWVIEPDGYGETRIDGQKAYCKVDFLFPVGDQIYILDWKTGSKNKKHSKQLTGYSLWANYHFQKDVKDIKAIAVYLFPIYQESQIEISQKDITDFAQQVKEETALMHEYVADIDKNIPKAKKAFAPTPNKMCNYCNYRQICPECMK
jgi:CRISPR/Cas system-associated exonuclease Cas4 (RecB family)